MATIIADRLDELKSSISRRAKAETAMNEMAMNLALRNLFIAPQITSTIVEN